MPRRTARTLSLLLPIDPQHEVRVDPSSDAGGRAPAQGRGGRFDPVNEDEAAALGRALLAELRGDDLTPEQLSLLERSRSAAAMDERAPTPVVDASDTLVTFGRGDDAEVWVSWRRYRGSSPFLDIRRFERAPDGEMRPTRQGVTIRARELGRLLTALLNAAKRLEDVG
ncbi:MAG: PC4/YdbC family ssDNA-binding protein [Sandaracinaceae bacterium]